MLKRNSKKGFTLAELLIVVAIIAILVAIAVPLFVGSLNKAKEARDNANVRAVRGAAVVYLLEHSGEAVWYSDGTKTDAKGWKVEATISSSGDITGLTIIADSAEATAAPAGYPTNGAVTESSGTFTVKLYLTNTEVTAKTTT